MDLTAVKERIWSKKRHSDVSEACRRAGVSTAVFYSAMRKDNYNDLCPAQISVLAAIVDLLDERIAMCNKLASGSC